MKKYLHNFKFFTLALGLMLTASIANAANRFSRASGNWNATTTWAATSGGAPGASVPVAGDVVTIESGFNVTLTANAACASITFTTATATSLTLGVFQLDVSGAITIPRSGAGVNLIAVGAGTLNAGSVAFTSSGTNVRHQITISTGTVTVSGNVTEDVSTGSASFTFTGAGLLRLGGSFLNAGTGTLTPSTGTVEYNQAGAQTVGDFVYNNLTLSGSGAKTTTGATVNGTLSMQGATATGTSPTYGGSAILEYKGSAAQTTGATEFPGTLNADLVINNATGVTLGAGAKTLNGNLTLTSGTLAAGNLLTMGAGGTPLITRDGGSITGTLQGTNDYDVTYTGSSKTTGPELSTTGLANMNINLTAGQTLTLDQARTPDGDINLISGIFAAGNFLTMDVGGTPVINVSGGSMTGNIQNNNGYDVVYTGNSKTTGGELSGTGLLVITVNLTAGQTLTLDQNRTPFDDLTITSGTFDLQGFTIPSANNGNLTINDGATLKIGGTNTFPAGYNNGIFGNTSATVEYAGTNQAVAAIPNDSYTNVVLSGSGIKTFAAETINGTLSIQGTATTAGAFTYGGSAILEYKGSGAQNTSNVEFPAAMSADVIINNAAGVTLNGAKTLSGNLTLTSGLLTTTSTNLLTLATGFGTSGASDNSFVNGPMAKIGTTAFTFPVGKSGAGLRTIGIGTPSASSTFQAEFLRANPQIAVGNSYGAGITQISACEYWTLDRTAGGNATVILSWAAASTCNGGGGGSYINDLAALRVARWTGATWENRTNGGTTGNGNIGTLTSNTVTTFSPFVVATSSNLNPLPVTFDDVKAFEKGTGVQIEWSNLTEKDVLNYVVERSANGRDFTAISQLASRSNLSDKQSYLSFDGSPLSGTNYYRIKVVEIDGKVIYSKVLKVEIGKNVKGIILYPNPVVGSDISIGFTAVKGQYTLRVMNNAGQEVYSKQIVHPGGSINQTVTLPSALKTGVYNLMISGDNYRENKKFIMQ